MSPLDRIARWTLARDRILVTDPGRIGRLTGGVVALLGLVMFASSRSLWTEPGSWADDALGLLLAALAGLAVTSILRVKMAYRTGWLEGRRAMVYALAEAQRRDLPPHEWLLSELERDYAVLGLDPELAREDAEGREEES